MFNTITIIEIIVAFLLIVSVLVQQRGTGLSGTFTGGGGGGESYHTVRGAEKILFISTIVLGTVFVGLAITNILLSV